jgi:hypothetical protein
VTTINVIDANGVGTYNRDHVETAYLLMLEHGFDLFAVQHPLQALHRLSRGEALAVMSAARRLIEQGVEP